MAPVSAERLQVAEHGRNGHGSARQSVATAARERLDRPQVRASANPAVRWEAAFAVYGGHGASQSSTIVYEIEPGGQLGWHTDATEETQYIIAGKGELQTE